jgi:hypothetical protein
MQQRLVVLVTCLVFTLFVPVRGFGETITWEHPTTYSDGSQIEPSKLPTIVSRIYTTRHPKDDSSWQLLSTVSSGGQSWKGTIPYGNGVLAWYTVTSSIPGETVESEKATATWYRINKRPPKPPHKIKMQRLTEAK